MKTYKDFGAFRKRIQKAPDWADYFRLNGRMFTLYEYGEGMGADYVCFRNERTGDTITVKYVCPSFQYVDGKRIQTKQYCFIDADYDYEMPAWR